MNFAIVDIETTGGQAQRDRITEVAIVIHDGVKIIDQWSTLINPEIEVPYYITKLTGISTAMVADAPKFYEIAKEIVKRTEGAVFVAHNVRFDYDFLKNEFAQLGFTYTRKQLCTVRISRAAFPGLPSYSLGNLIKHFKIKVRDRHRALADAVATAVVFAKALAQLTAEGRDVFGVMLPSQLRDTPLPLGWTVEKLMDIPDECGVYYLHDTDGKVVYVGKSIHIRQRLFEHFKDRTPKAAKLQRLVAEVSVELTGSEIAAEIFEAHEIKRLLPIANVTQRQANFPFAIFATPDAAGYLCFFTDKNNIVNRKNNLLVAELLRAGEARHSIYAWCERYNLCLQKGGWQEAKPCFFRQIDKCAGACSGHESVADYNEKVMQFATKQSTQLEGSFLLLDKGRSLQEKTVVWVHEGQYQGYAYVDVEETMSAEDMMEAIRPQATTPDIQRLIRLYMAKNQARIKIISL